MMNENHRLDYLAQLGVVSWMPRQPLPGAKPSDYFYHAAPEKSSPLARLQQGGAVPGSSGHLSVTPAVQPGQKSPDQAVLAQTQAQAVIVSGQGRPAVSAQSTEHDPMADLADEPRVNRVPDYLQLAFIRQQGDRPLIVSHFGEHGDSEQAFLPFIQSLLQFVAYPEPLVSLPFVWPLAGMPPVCREQEFVQVFRALVGGARLGCQPNQKCWWFGDLPELIAESDNLLNISLHYPKSLTHIMTSATDKRALLHQLIALKQEI